MGHCMLSKLSGTPLKPFLKKGLRIPKTLRASMAVSRLHSIVSHGAQKGICAAAVWQNGDDYATDYV